MTEAKVYQGSCHCGAVAFEVEAAIADALACNCSICNRAGYLLTFVGADKFKLLRGEDAQTDYQFGKKHIHHTFCKTCGVRSFSAGATPEGGTMYAVNVRCLEGVDVSALPVNHYDGKSL